MINFNNCIKQFCNDTTGCIWFLWDYKTDKKYFHCKDEMELDKKIEEYKRAQGVSVTLKYESFYKKYVVITTIDSKEIDREEFDNLDDAQCYHAMQIDLNIME